MQSKTRTPARAKRMRQRSYKRMRQRTRDPRQAFIRKEMKRIETGPRKLGIYVFVGFTKRR